MQKLLTEDEVMGVRNELRKQKFPVLSHGFVQLINVMGGDQAIVDAARTTSALESKQDADDENLIRFLMRHRHTTPTEFAEIHVLVVCPMDTWRQWIRHRTASVNEFSSRYSEVPDINDVTRPDNWRLQSKVNRQGSSGQVVDMWPEGVQPVPFGDDDQPVLLAGDEMEMHTRWGILKNYPSDTQELLAIIADHEGLPTPGEYLSQRERDFHIEARELYQDRLNFGVAKEVARKDLPLSTYTRAHWKMDLGNLFHFLGLRMDGHAQLEIRSYANIIGEEIVSKLFPVSWQAFLDYRLNAMTLTALDQGVVSKLASTYHSKSPWTVDMFMASQPPRWIALTRCRERDECLAKLQNLGLVVK